MTHPDIIRYFMTIPEAARLVLQAAAIGKSGQVLVMDMGEPIKIADLARDMIRLAGHQPGEIAIEFTGLRPGEKLFEELLADADLTLPSQHPRLRIAQLEAQWNAEPLAELQSWLIASSASATPREVREKLARCVPEYRQAR